MAEPVAVVRMWSDILCLRFRPKDGTADTQTSVFFREERNHNKYSTGFLNFYSSPCGLRFRGKMKSQSVDSVDSDALLGCKENLAVPLRGYQRHCLAVVSHKVCPKARTVRHWPASQTWRIFLGVSDSQT